MVWWRTRAVTSATAALVASMALGALGAAPADAAMAAPTALAPTGAGNDHTPLLSWARVSGAVRYEVQVSRASTYDGSNVVYDRSTTNRRASVSTRLPTGLAYWRVRGISSTGVNGSWGSATVNVTPQAGPTPLGPANDPDGTHELAQPGNPPLLRWTPVAGAAQYTVEVDTESDFIGASTYRTSTTSKVVPDAKVGGRYYWHVSAQMTGTGEQTAWSPVWTYKIGTLAPVTVTSPADDADTGLTDVVLDWDPVPGAREYQLRVDNDVDFNSPIDTTTVQSTRYSPPATYRNDQYYWQVRAVNLNGEYRDWESLPKPQFKRSWPERPTLQYPADSLTPVGDDFYYQWKPVPHASFYQLEVGSDPNFSPNSYATCRTDQTTYTPGGSVGEGCMPAQGQQYFWRVLPYDAPSNIPGLYSAVQTFTYSSGAVMQVAPADGATVAVPTLSWQASQDAERYRVEIKNPGGGVVASVDTYALSWTPPGRLDPSSGPYTWTVQAIDADGKVSPRYEGRTFSLGGSATTGAAALAPLTPVPSSGSQRFPALSWEPMAGAAYYQVRMAPTGAMFRYNDGDSPLLGTRLEYPAATDWGSRFLSPGRYDWWVEAYSSSNTVIGTGTRGTFDILDLNAVGGLQVALNGTDLDAGRGCRALLHDTTPGAAHTCDNAPSTPVLDWDPVPQAAFYLVYMSKDRSFTNLVYNAESTSNSRWTPSQGHNPSSLPDNTAGQAYYWLVRPCKAWNKCAPDPLSTLDPSDSSFSKQSPQVALTSPADGGSAADDVRFDWVDYRDTNAGTANPWSGSGVASQQSGQRYRIEISPKANFASEVYAREVDQTTFTPYDDTLPEGTLYWRVQAIDQAGNHLRWSDTRSFSKASPKPVLTSPTAAAVAPTTPAFQWDALSFAGSYQLEVYKNNDTAFSDANRVVSATVTQVAYTLDQPLAPSASSYVWRVRRMDSRGRPGAWSQTGRFTVSSSAPALAYPTSGGYVSHADVYFTWEQVQGATRYHFERRVANSSGNVEQADTPGTSWTSDDISDGSWEWRVSAFDNANNLLGTTAWRAFKVDGTRPTVTSKSPASSGSRTASFVARFSEPVTGVSGTTMRLFVRGGTRAVAARVTVDAARRTATLNPTASLTSGKYYVVKLTGASIKDAAGNTLVAPSWTVRAK